MLTILHGDNITASRNELQRIQSTLKNTDIRNISGKIIKEEDLRQSLESQSMFGGDVYIIIEQLFTTLGRKEKMIERFADIIRSVSDSVNVCIWEPKELRKSILDRFKRAHIELFKMPAIIFSFLDSLSPLNKRNTLLLYEKLEMSDPPELILYMTENRIRQLIQLKDTVMPSKMSGWQRSRLTNQVRSFTMDKLLAMHRSLIDLEYSFKTGASPYTLSQLIKNFILDL